MTTNAGTKRGLSPYISDSSAVLLEPLEQPSRKISRLDEELTYSWLESAQPGLLLQALADPFPADVVEDGSVEDFASGVQALLGMHLKCRCGG